MTKYFQIKEQVNEWTWNYYYVLLLEETSKEIHNICENIIFNKKFEEKLL